MRNCLKSQLKLDFNIDMNPTVLEVIRYLGIINCLFLALVLIKKKNNPGNPYLAVLLVLIGINLYFLNNIHEELIAVFPEVIILIDWFPLAYAPLIYLYIKFSLEVSSVSAVKQSMKHFIPSLLNCIYLLIIYGVRGRQGFRSMVMEILRGDYPWYFFLSMAVKLLMAGVYIGLLLRMIRINKEILESCGENLRRRRWYLILMIGFGFCYLSPLLDLLLNLDLMYESLTILFFVLWVYLAVYQSTLNPNIFQDGKIYRRIRHECYSSENHRTEVKRAIEALFTEEKIHLQSELKLKDFAAALGEPINRTSFYINDLFQVNFQELVNRHRLQFFLELQRESTVNKTILELAMESGFNSKTSFNRVFKAEFSMTPSEYIKAQN